MKNLWVTEYSDGKKDREKHQCHLLNDLREIDSRTGRGKVSKKEKEKRRHCKVIQRIRGCGVP